MDFSPRADDPRRHLVGFGLVVLLHLGVVYALLNGVGKTIVEAVRAPIETRLIDEIKPPPPSPPPPEPPPPKAVQAPKRIVPPPVFIPPPEVVVIAPAPPVPTITVTALPPPVPVEIAPIPPPAAPAPAPQPTGPVAASIACSRTPPPLAPNVANEVKGSLFVVGTLKAGRVVQVDIERNTLQGVSDRRSLRAFISAIEVAMKDGYVCTGDGVQIRQEFFFDIR